MTEWLGVRTTMLPGRNGFIEEEQIDIAESAYLTRFLITELSSSSSSGIKPLLLLLLLLLLQRE